MQNHLSDPKSVVLAFAAAYTAWELAMEAAEAHTDDPFDDPKLCDQRRDILLMYCTHKERKYDGGNSFSIPTTYGLLTEENIDIVESVSSSRVHVDTKKLSKAAYRFVVLKKKDGWRIESVKWRMRSGWQNTLFGS
ncbi:MAG: NTF2 fold immunity protein [Pirellulaceae bacterium]|nr:NTF2 fold immunity protein [Pirellulaceae bacterium]